MKIRNMFPAKMLKIAGMLFLTYSIIGKVGFAMEIKKIEIDGQEVLLMENEFYSSILVPERAMLPLTYKFKPTGNDVFIRRENLSRSFACCDGLTECLPWVGSCPKGLLMGAKWDVSLKKEDNLVKLIGRAKIEYKDVLTGGKSKLSFKKTIIGAENTSQIRMDYEIENIGEEKATFIFAAHARVAAGGDYDEGDYFFAPEGSCWIGCMKWGELEKRGIKPYSWRRWPIKGIEEYKPKPKEDRKGEHIYVFIPTYWSAVGDVKTKELILFWNTPLQIGGREQQMYTCYLRREGDYLVEISGTPSLDYYNTRDKEKGLVHLAPSQKCTFTICMSVYKNTTHSDIATAKSVYPDYIIAEKPKIRFKSGKIRLSGKIRAAGILRFKLLGISRGNKEVVLWDRMAGPGMIELNSWEIVIHKEIPGSIELVITDAFGKEMVVREN